MKVWLVILGLACFLAGAAHAGTQWMQVSESLSGNITYVDLASIETNGEMTYYWGKLQYGRQARKTRDPVVNGVKVAYTMFHAAADCANHLDYSASQWVHYGPQDQVLSNGQLPAPPVAMATPGPDTAGGALHEIVCYAGQVKAEIRENQQKLTKLKK